MQGKDLFSIRANSYDLVLNGYELSSGSIRIHDSAEQKQVFDLLGISEEDRARVFEEFFQARTALHATAKGTGLGLPFALRVAEALQGTIELESALGEGSRFTVHLPVRPVEPGA